MAVFLAGHWQDTNGFQRYNVQPTFGTKKKIHIDVMSIEGKWQFGGDHLVRIQGDTAFWGHPVDRYFCRLTEIKHTGLVRWYRCGSQEKKAIWEWKTISLKSAPQKQTIKPKNVLPIGSDMFAASEYDPESWWPVKLVAVVDEEDGQYLVVSTQDGSHKWTVDNQSAVLCSDI